MSRENIILEQEIETNESAEKISRGDCEVSLDIKEGRLGSPRNFLPLFECTFQRTPDIFTFKRAPISKDPQTIFHN